MGGGRRRRRDSDHQLTAGRTESEEISDEVTDQGDQSVFSFDSFDDDPLLHDIPEEDEISRRRRSKTYLEVIESYHRSPVFKLQICKDVITSYKPGYWIEGVGGTMKRDYEVPEITTLLLIGPRGSGKSSLVNRISSALEEGLIPEFPPDRAQVSHRLSVSQGTCFLQEYMVPRYSRSFCIYDTRSLSSIPSENFKLLKKWMTEGVYHGEMVIRDSDPAAVRNSIKARARQGRFNPCKRRAVNFVIFVVDAISVLRSIKSKDTQYIDMLVETFNYPFLSFNDNKPVVVITHGDELPLAERARVRTHLGELLGIPPTIQIIDIPLRDEHNPITESAIVEMLRYSLDRADRNLPFKQDYLLKGRRILERMIDKLRDFDFDIWLLLTIEVFVICLCIIILLVRYWGKLTKR